MSTGNTVVVLMTTILLSGGMIGVGTSATGLGLMGHEIGDWKLVGAVGITVGTVGAGWAGVILLGLVADLRETILRLRGLM